MTVQEIIIRDHGSDCLLASGSEGEEIVKTYQGLLDSGAYSGQLAKIFYGDTPPAECAAREAYRGLVDKVMERWLTNVSREEMLGTANCLAKISGGGFIEFLPGEKLWVVGLVAEWNKRNPDQETICVNGNYYP